MISTHTQPMNLSACIIKDHPSHICDRRSLHFVFVQCYFILRLIFAYVNMPISPIKTPITWQPYAKKFKKNVDLKTSRTIKNGSKAPKRINTKPIIIICMGVNIVMTSFHLVHLHHTTSIGLNALH